jgi:hypothetical protein
MPQAFIPDMHGLILGQGTGYLDSGFSWSFPVRSGKFRDITLITPQSYPSKSFPVFIYPSKGTRGSVVG